MKHIDTYFIQANAQKRNALAKHLYEKGIYTTLRYHPLYLNPIYQSKGTFSNNEQLNKTGLTIPLQQNLSDSNVELIAENIKAYL